MCQSSNLHELRDEAHAEVPKAAAPRMATWGLPQVNTHETPC